MNIDELRDALSAKIPRTSTKVVLKELDNAEVHIFCMTGEQRAKYDGFVRGEPANRDMYLFPLLAYSMCDEEGTPIYPDNNGSEYHDWPATLIDSLSDIASRLSFMTIDDVEVQKKS